MKSFPLTEVDGANLMAYCQLMMDQCNAQVASYSNARVNLSHTVREECIDQFLKQVQLSHLEAQALYERLAMTFPVSS
jgi:hypothetical protein